MRFDWLGLLQAGQTVGVTPEAFWRLTPAELRLLLGDSGGSVLGRERLDELMRAFPDKG